MSDGITRMYDDHEDAVYLATKLKVDTKGLPSFFDDHDVIKQYARTKGVRYTWCMTAEEVDAAAGQLEANRAGVGRGVSGED